MAEDAQLAQQMLEIFASWIKPKVTYVIARLGLVDKMLPVGTVHSTDTLAEQVGVKPLTLKRVLRVACLDGLMKEHENNQGFSVTPLGGLLAEDHPGKFKYFIMTWNLPIHNNSFGKLYEGITQDKPALEVAFGEGARVFDLFAHDKMEEKVFEQAMSALTFIGTQAALSFDFSGCKKVVDVGGCAGDLTAAILKQHPHLVGVNFDRDDVVADLPAIAPELAGRMSHVGGDFFQPFPKEVHGADVIVMKHVMHDWGNNFCVTILKHCAAVLAPGGKIVIVDHILPDTAGQAPGSVPSFIFALDMTMLSLTEGGNERSLAGWQELFAEAGLAPPEVVFNQGLGCLVTQPLA